ncbi:MULTISPECIES: LysR family transcriptional regulator [Paraburkholderia]|uniref:LysR family transcriptional regulator n=1 Tax=Paraburkholderia TaxID=1822464 RepID=UPI00224D8CF1|nr:MULTISPECIES: LysR family transcriptional regulator [Paraburkholderia]MCX4162530.1 LysR family transcriptional regulator [Paraburkholderia megapolitana]MDN7158025.1 LysR family transcriptional regulator [Paraburkholderia sp. CHISQ3]MDQ6495072.1 LysR family transcriptional regulator [Paraburkholderia megapolitana]
MDISDLTDMKMFALVAEAGGFRFAALRNGLSASSLSDAIQRLEKLKGVRLMNRTTRSVTPTEAGQQLLERLRPALSELDAAFDSIAMGDQATGTLRLDVPGIVARHVLPQIASAFLVAHPTIRMEVTVTEGLVDVFAANCDAGVRYEEHLARDMIAVPIGPARQRLVGVAAPDYLARHGVPAHPRDLNEHACIRHMFGSGRRIVWELKRKKEIVRVVPDGRLASESSDVEVAGAVAGLGILFTFEEFVAEPLADGRLVRVLNDWQEEFAGPRLYYNSRRQMPAALRVFVDFIKSQSRSGR